MGAQISLRRPAESTTLVSLGFQVTRIGHRLYGQSTPIEIWTELSVDTAAKRNALKGCAAWPVAWTETTADSPKATLAGVPLAETRRIAKWLGNGAAKVEGTLTAIVRIPGADPWELKISGWAMENLGKVSVKTDGSDESLEGGITGLLIDGIDPLGDPDV